MKRAALGLCVATAFAASLAAQSQQPPSTTSQPGTSPAQSTAAGAAGDITITGCLQKGADGAFTLSNVQQDASATGTSGSTGAAAGATSAPGAASTPGATAGASAGGASAAASQTWALKGGDLAAHVGHRIAVTGKRAMASSSSASGATSTSGAAAGATADPSSASRPAATSGSSASNMRTLEVSSVKMVSANCQ